MWIQWIPSYAGLFGLYLLVPCVFVPAAATTERDGHYDDQNDGTNGSQYADTHEGPLQSKPNITCVVKINKNSSMKAYRNLG
jgi:hypothetical protein